SAAPFSDSSREALNISSNAKTYRGTWTSRPVLGIGLLTQHGRLGQSCIMVQRERKIAASSWLVSAGRPSAAGAPLNAPLVPASNFVLGGEGAYAREDGTPTWEALEEVVGRLEEGRAVSFSSAMAAIAAVFDQLSNGAVVVIPADCYQGVAGLALDGQ